MCSHTYDTTLLHKSRLSQIEQKTLRNLWGPKPAQAIHRYFKYVLKGYALSIFTAILNYKLAFVFKFSYLEVKEKSN